MKNPVRMAGNWSLGIGHQQSPGHTEMHDPLQSRQVKNNVFTYAVNASYALPRQLGSHQLWRRFKWLGLLAEPGGLDAVSTQTFIHTTCDRLNFWQFRHG